MKIVYHIPVLALTGEEEGALYRASEILESICNKTDDYDQCKSKCPIYRYCPYHHSFVNNINGRTHDLLNNIINEAERE